MKVRAEHARSQTMLPVSGPDEAGPNKADTLMSCHTTRIELPRQRAQPTESSSAQMTAREKVDFVKEHGDKEFQSLPL